MMNLVFIFVAFGWFVLVDNFRKKKYLPLVIRTIFRIYNKRKNILINKSEKIKSQPKISGKTEEVEEILEKKDTINLENDIESEISTLNFVAFILLFLSMLCSYIYIILSISA